MTLEAKNLSFRYHKNSPSVIKDFSLTLGSHEIVGISSPSGSGKTTLLKLLADYELAQAGGVFLDGKPLNMSYKGFCPVQMIWQHPETAVNPRLKMQRVLEEGHVQPRIMEALQIEKGWLKRYAGELSGGELQRFCIARALNEKTRFILADEITAMLDPITQAQLWGFLLAEAQSRGIGLLIASHSAALLSRLCGRIVTLPGA